MRPFVTAAALLLLAGCSSDPSPATPAAAPAPARTTAAPSPSAGPADPYGKRACELVGRALDAENLLDEGVVEAIAEAGRQSANGYVANAARFLPDRLELAVAAKGSDDEFAMSTGLTTAAIEMQTECVRGRLT